MSSDAMERHVPVFDDADSCLTIDLDALASNWRSLAEAAGDSVETSAVVKGNGYGLGADVIAPAIADAGCRTFFVMSLGEARELRASLVSAGHGEARILALCGCHAGQEDAYRESAIIPVINTLEQLERLNAVAERNGEAIEAALHVDTGMTRLGLGKDEADWLVRRREEDPVAFNGVEVKLLMSHLCASENPEDPANPRQLARFEALCASIPAQRASLSNSGGILLGADYHFDMTRPGIAICGMHPAGRGDAGNPDGGEHRLRAAVNWHARILPHRRARRGDAVGYNATHVLDRDSRIATLGVGYADGYPRSLGGKAVASISGRPAPVIGRVSMDSITVDATDIPERIVDEACYATVLGDDYELAAMAEDANTIGYEVLTGLGRRPRREYFARAERKRIAK